jgi:hypothetical protein
VGRQPSVVTVTRIPSRMPYSWTSRRASSVEAVALRGPARVRAPSRVPTVPRTPDTHHAPTSPPSHTSRQSLRVRREMRLRVRLGCDLPHRAEIPAGRVRPRERVASLDPSLESDGLPLPLEPVRNGSRPSCGVRLVAPACPLRRLPHRVRVIEIPRRPRQQKHLLMALGRPVRHRLRHRVRLRPDDLAAQVPAVRLEGEREPPRDADEVLRLEARSVRARTSR